MTSTRLWEIFHNLDKKEIKEISKFVRSPYNNNRDDVSKFFEILAFHKIKNTPLPSSEAIFMQIYDKSMTFSNTQMHHLSSWLLKLIENYFIQSEVKENIPLQNQILLQSYAKRKLERHFDRHFQFSLQELNKVNKDAKYYDYLYQLNEDYFQFHSNQSRLTTYNFQEISDNLDIAYISKKLRSSCFMLSHQILANTQYELRIISLILEYINDYEYTKHPSIGIYYYLYRAMQNEADMKLHFDQFINILKEHEHEFSSNELRDIYLLALNICIKKNNEDQTEFTKLGLELYKKGISQKLLLKDGVLSRFTFRNIVSFAIKLNDFQWVKNFIDDYSSQIEKEHRESMISFNLARLAYAQQDYTQAMLLLQKSDYKDVLLNLASKTLLLKIYYELNEFSLLEYHLDAMKVFLNRHKSIGYHKNNYLALTKFTRKLINLESGKSLLKTKLLEQVMNTKLLVERSWLINKIKDAQ